MQYISYLIFGSGLAKKIFIGALAIGCIIAIVSLFWDKYFGKEVVNKKNGEKYEKSVIQYIKYFLGADAYHHLLFDKGDIIKSETDIAFINRKGIFCVECKYTSLNVKPKIALSMKQWNMESYFLDNPFDQNESHIRVIKNCISNNPDFKGKKITFFNMVCIDFEYIFTRFMQEYDSSKHPYIPMFTDGKILLTTKNKKLAKEGFSAFKKDMDRLPDVFTDEEIEIIQEVLKEHVATKEQLEQNIYEQKKKQFFEQKRY